MKEFFQLANGETKVVCVGNKSVLGRVDCGRRRENSSRVFDDIVNGVAPKSKAVDGLIGGFPVYCFFANETLKSFLMVFLVKSASLGKEKYGPPEKEETITANFIRKK